MKKLMYFTLMLVMIASISMFGAWSPDTQVAATETRYYDSPIVSTVADTQIFYTSREVVEEGETSGGAPLYNSNEGYANACGPLAGTAIVAFYDKYCPNLIPDWESFYPTTGKYRLQEANVRPVLDELYTLMQTNVKGDGVSESEFKTGLSTYVINHGYSIEYENARSSSWLNYNACKTAIDSNNVVVLFTTPGDVIDLGKFSDHDTATSISIAGNHIMYAFGYIRIKYYNDNGLFRTDTYLKVSTGRSSMTFALFRVDSSNVEAAYRVIVE